jgi:hypothetical protein
VCALPLVCACAGLRVSSQYTGECECISGYAGRACDYQDTAIAAGILEL